LERSATPSRGERSLPHSWLAVNRTPVVTCSAGTICQSTEPYSAADEASRW